MNSISELQKTHIAPSRTREETALPPGAREIRPTDPDLYDPDFRQRTPRFVGAESDTHVLFWRHQDKKYYPKSKRELCVTMPDAELVKLLRERAQRAGLSLLDYTQSLLAADG